MFDAALPCPAPLPSSRTMWSVQWFHYKQIHAALWVRDHSIRGTQGNNFGTMRLVLFAVVQVCLWLHVWGNGPCRRKAIRTSRLIFTELSMWVVMLILVSYDCKFLMTEVKHDAATPVNGTPSIYCRWRQFCRQEAAVLLSILHTWQVTSRVPSFMESFRSERDVLQVVTPSFTTQF